MIMNHLSFIIVAIIIFILDFRHLWSYQKNGTIWRFSLQTRPRIWFGQINVALTSYKHDIPEIKRVNVMYKNVVLMQYVYFVRIRWWLNKFSIDSEMLCDLCLNFRCISVVIQYFYSFLQPISVTKITYSQTWSYPSSFRSRSVGNNDGTRTNKNDVRRRYLLQLPIV